MTGQQVGNKRKRLVFLVGPTAVGKTGVAVALAKKINAEIISCDSMQVYKGMDLLTSKPASALRKKAKHHLIGVIAPIKEYNVSRYRKEALAKVKAILKKHKIPLFVGGTGLYLSILLDGIFKAKAQDKKIRERLYKEAEAKGGRFLYERLRQVDPPAAAKIHPNDTRRIVRSLEVYELTGQPISHLQKERKGLIDEYDVRIFCLDRERDKLYERINRRVDKMFKAGLVAEVKKLLKVNLSKTARYAIGLRELRDYFDAKTSLEEAKALIKRNSRWYAKRQLTWFRKDKRIEWVQVAPGETPKAVSQRILDKITG